MKIFRQLLLSVALLPALAEAVPSEKSPQVLASVHPLGLVAASVVPADNLQILLPPGVTPHDFSLRPSDIDVIQNADVVFWAGAEAEPYLSGFARRWPDKVWIDVSDFATPEDAADHHHHGHDHHHHDPHWWLNPLQMVAAQARLASVLEQDPAPFRAAVEQQLQASALQLEPLRNRGFFVFHRAWDHWVEYFGLLQKGSFTLTPEQKPGLKTLQTMRRQLQQGEVVCVFSEPEFSPALVESVVKGLPVKRGELDPMAQHIPLQADGYVQYMADLTARFADCLQP